MIKESYNPFGQKHNPEYITYILNLYILNKLKKDITKVYIKLGRMLLFNVKPINLFWNMFNLTIPPRPT